MTSRKIPESAVENLVSDLEGKANVANTVTTNTTQTISASKKISIGGTAVYGRPFEIMMPTSTESNPTKNTAREIAFLSSDGTGNNYEGSLAHGRTSSGDSYTGLRAGRLVNGTYKEGTMVVRILENGTSFATAPSTPANPANTVIVTADYVKNNYVDKTSTQTISGAKTFSDGTLHALKPVLLKENNENEGGQIYFQLSNNSVLKDNPYIDLWKNSIRVIGRNSNNTVNSTLQVDLENNQVIVPTPATTANDTQAASTAWVNAKLSGFANTNASNFSQAGKSYLSGLGMPSTRYEDLTLGASGSTYTAPANGTVLAIKRASAVGQSLGLKRVSSNIFFDFAWCSIADSNIFVNMNVRKGEVFGVEYTASGTETQILRFYYAEGENNV